MYFAQEKYLKRLSESSGTLHIYRVYEKYHENRISKNYEVLVKNVLDKSCRAKIKVLVGNFDLELGTKFIGVVLRSTLYFYPML